MTGSGLYLSPFLSICILPLSIFLQHNWPTYYILPCSSIDFLFMGLLFFVVNDYYLLIILYNYIFGYFSYLHYEIYYPSIADTGTSPPRLSQLPSSKQISTQFWIKMQDGCFLYHAQFFSLLCRLIKSNCFIQDSIYILLSMCTFMPFLIIVTSQLFPNIY